MLRLGGNAQVPLVEGPRNESGGALRVFDGFGHLLRHDSFIACQRSRASHALSEGIKTFKTFSGGRGEEFYN